MDATWDLGLDDTGLRVKSITIELTRRNLLALLAKLDGHPPDSGCELRKTFYGAQVAVRAVENDAHYADHDPGALHPATERSLLARALDSPESKR